MLRDQWNFEFGAKQLAEAAGKKRAHHEGRLKFWTEAKASVMAEVKDSGIEVSESAAGGDYAMHSNRVNAPQVMVRNDLQHKLSECHQKIQEHAGRVREYAGWVHVLQGNPESRLRLHADDYLFFFGE